MKKYKFVNHYSYGRYGITIFKHSLSITEYGGKEKNAQHKQYLYLPNRYWKRLIKFYLSYKDQPKGEKE